MRADGLKKAVIIGIRGRGGSRGKSRTRCIDEIGEKTGMLIGELKEAVCDEIGWRRGVMEITRGRFRPEAQGNK